MSVLKQRQVNQPVNPASLSNLQNGTLHQPSPSTSSYQPATSQSAGPSTQHAGGQSTNTGTGIVITSSSSFIKP